MIVAEEYQELFQHGTIGNMKLKNRLAMAPVGLVGLVENDGSISQRAIDYYEERAKGGVGLIITGAVRACSKLDPYWVEGRYFTRARIDSTIVLDRLSQLAERVHDYDCKLCIQLTAGHGRVARPISGQQAVSASAVSLYWQPSVTTRTLTIEEVEELAESFGAAARLAKSAGVDAIELHCHEGYLFDQFMTSLWNKRGDKYGGATVRERMTLPLEVIESINHATGGTLPIIFRFALTHKLQGGRTEEEGMEICRIVEDAGVSALDVDAGCYENWYWPHPPAYQPPACMLDLAAKAKQVVRKIPVMCVGKMNYPAIAAKALKEGKADFVIIGRGLLADPEWPNKVRKGKVEEIRPCFGCHEGCLARVRRRSTSCAVNPACGDERALSLAPAQQKKKVLVIGGGPAGMEAARVAKLRGHRVTLYEKCGELGGQLIPASAPGFKEDLRLLRKYYANEMQRLGIKVLLNTQATSRNIAQAKPDVVFLATGGVSRIPIVPGIDSPKVLTAIDVLKGKAVLGKDISIVGGGMTGCELAVHLAQQSKRITIIEMLPRVLGDMGHVHPNQDMLMKMLEENHITILVNSTFESVTESGVMIVDKNSNKQEIPADSVVIAIGLISQDNLYRELEGKVDEVYRIGDCLTPGKIIDAVWEAYRKARII